MAKNSKKCRITAEDFRKMAEGYGLGDNPLILSQIEQYDTQRRVMDVMKSALDEADPAVSKEYVKGRENLYAHPLIKELPKHADSATRTADSIVRAIRELGNKGGDDDGFEAFIESR